MREVTKDKIAVKIEPNHPITRDMIGFDVILDGEKISKINSNLGFSHKGIEKAGQDRYIGQYLPVIEKIDYFAPFFYSHAFLSALERLSEIELPLYAQYVRVLTMELNRITSHLSNLGRFMDVLNCRSAAFHFFNMQNEILNIFEKISGGRISCNYYVFGGVKNNICREILTEILNFTSKFKEKFKILQGFTKENPVFLDRTRNKGIIDTQNALEYSITGVNLRASGLNLDFRKEKPYLLYDKLEFYAPTVFEGDCYSRFALRLDEIKISIELVKQCLDWLLSNCEEKCNLENKLSDICPKAGAAVSFTEGPRGLIMCHVVSDGGKKLKRVKWRTPSFYSIQILEKALIGLNLADFAVIFDSLDINSSEADR